ncbi:cache domain-containing protein [Pseudomonas sp. SLFW]|uniref:cache domain-containing protein n=1 Tax=Pseudomonas sp. SLFW TaxID=2683259 RepID=UPI0014122770|nr:cache domain-containing protein [Pseudomonas sp. SLFW]NBB11452.1 calcium channel protein [Pseudomonas sp. SLFW]
MPVVSKRRTWKTLLFAAFACIGMSQAMAANDEQEAASAKALLEKAVTHYRQVGDKALAEFSRQGEFVNGERYVFVTDTNGVMLASGGPSVVLIGRDISSVLDPDLQKGFKEVLQTPESAGIQQAEYRWQNWRDGKVERKRVYFQRVGNRILAVGYYLPRAAPEQARALLDKASKALEQDQDGTVQAINSLKGGFLQDDLYVFVVNVDTKRYVAHGTNLRLVNTDFSKIKDPEGKPVGRPMLEMLKKQPEGEYEYRWRNPVTGKIEHKHAYTRKVGDFLVAVGYYSG